MRWWAVREREKKTIKKKKGSEKKKKKIEVDISIKLLVTIVISSLLATFSNEPEFVADNDTNVYDFIFSNNLFLSLFVTFSNKMSFVTNSVLSNTISDKSFCHKKLKLLVTK